MSDEEVEFPTLIKNWPKDRVDPEETEPESGDPFTPPPSERESAEEE